MIDHISHTPTTAPEGSGPIFVCGPSRSGTALMRSILNAHSRIHIAGETHYFDDLRIRLADQATSPILPEDATTTQNYFLALGHRPYGHQGDPEKGRIPREDLASLATELGQSGDAHFAAYCTLEARAQDKPIWGEKTPRHIYRIGDMLSAFPEARVVCLIRDARAIVASYRDWRNQGGFDLEADPGHKAVLTAEQKRAKRSYHPIIISLLWRGAMKAAIAAQEQFGEHRVRLQKYESLPTHPEEDIRELADWLGIDFEPDMASPPMHNSSYNQFQKKAGVSNAPVDRWRKKLSPTEIATVESACGPILQKLGYDLLHPPGTTLGVGINWCLFPFAAARAAVVNRKRIPNLPGYISSRLGIGMPGHSRNPPQPIDSPKTPGTAE